MKSRILIFVAGLTIGAMAMNQSGEENVKIEKVEVPVERVVTKEVRVSEIPEACIRAADYAKRMADATSQVSAAQGEQIDVLDEAMVVYSGAKYKTIAELQSRQRQIRDDLTGGLHSIHNLHLQVDKEMEECK